MAKYRVHGTITVSCWTEVTARSEAEALRIAQGRQVAEVYIDPSYPEDDCWQIDSDGTPENLRIDS